MTRLTVQSALDEVDDEKVNALEQPYFGRQDRIPAKWDAQHVGRRLVDALEIDSRMPRVRGPKEPGAAWPAYRHEFADLVGLTALERRERESAQNRTRIVPSSEEVGQRDKVLEWFREIRRVNESWFARLMAWTDASYRNVNHLDLCRSKKWSVRTYWRHVDKAKSYLAQWLNQQNVMPW